MRFKYILSEMMLGLWRNITMTVAMIITMAVSLFLLGSSLLLFQQINNMKDYYFAQVQVAVYLTNDVTDDQRTAIESALKGDPLVKQPVIHETKDQAYTKFKEDFKDAPDLVAATKPEALPESYRVKLKNPNQYQQVYDKYHSMQGVSDVIDQRKLLDRVFSILGALQNGALGVAILQGVAALLLVGNTIQVAAYSRRREVAVMKLVGASNWFIQAPFVLEAMFAGVIGAIVASLLLAGGKIWFVDGALKPLTQLLTPLAWYRVALMAPILIAIGAVISGVTGWVTLRFYIKK